MWYVCCPNHNQNNLLINQKKILSASDKNMFKTPGGLKKSTCTCSIGFLLNRMLFGESSKFCCYRCSIEKYDTPSPHGWSGTPGVFKWSDCFIFMLDLRPHHCWSKTCYLFPSSSPISRITRSLVQIGFVMHHNSLSSVNLHTQSIHSYLTLSYKFLTTLPPKKQW